MYAPRLDRVGSGQTWLSRRAQLGKKVAYINMDETMIHLFPKAQRGFVAAGTGSARKVF